MASNFHLKLVTFWIIAFPTCSDSWYYCMWVQNVSVNKINSLHLKLYLDDKCKYLFQTAKINLEYKRKRGSYFIFLWKMHSWLTSMSSQSSQFPSLSQGRPSKSYTHAHTAGTLPQQSLPKTWHQRTHSGTQEKSWEQLDRFLHSLCAGTRAGRCRWPGWCSRRRCQKISGCMCRGRFRCKPR